jgi:hypothetical protein
MNKYDLIHVGLLLRGNSANDVVVPDSLEQVINYLSITQEFPKISMLPPISPQGLDAPVRLDQTDRGTPTHRLIFGQCLQRGMGFVAPHL